jgi:hypothetical protein
LFIASFRSERRCPGRPLELVLHVPSGNRYPLRRTQATAHRLTMDDGAASLY